MAKRLETFRGGVFPWEIDVMGHMNVRVYVEKQLEGNDKEEHGGGGGAL